MDKRGQFEQKIKAKLEQLETPDADKAWASFSTQLHGVPAPFWKHWSMPYVYATVLFLGAFAWITMDRRGSGTEEVQPPSVLHRVDTLYRIDTVWVIDTVVVNKRVYVEETITQVTRSRPYGQGFEYLAEGAEETGNEVAKNKRQHESTGVLGASGGEKKDSSPAEAISEKAADDSVVSVDSIATDGVGDDALGIRPPVHPKADAAQSETVDESYFRRAQRETVVGDTSNLNKAPVRTTQKPSFHVELGSSLLFPISRLVEYYTPIQQKIRLGLEWESGWALYAGAIRNESEGELDDEEIMSLGNEIIASLPNVPQDIQSLDEIYFRSRQWFFPVEIGWRSPYFNQFSFESSLGIIGNWLSRQNFTYEFENNRLEEYQYATEAVREFRISHAKIGIGTNYLLRNRFGFFLRSHYWLPVSRTGLLKDRMHGIEVGVGVNVKLSK